MSQVKLISLERVIASLYRDLNTTDELSENDIVEWAGEALEQIGAYPQYEEAIEYLDVEGHKAMLPCGLHQIVQIAYKTTPSGSAGCAIKIEQSDGSTVCNSSSCGCSDTEVCSTTDDTVVTTAQQLIDYHLQYRFVKTDAYYQNYKPMSLATGNFSAAKAIHCENCINISSTCDEEYSINHPYITTSFQKGHLCLAYIRQPLDDRGWPMIPDEVSYVEAIKRYVVYKLKYGDFLTGKVHPNIYTKLEQDWHWYCSQARNKMNMPNSIDKLQNLTNQWNRLIPNKNRYYGFFGNMSKPERLNLN